MRTKVGGYSNKEGGKQRVGAQSETNKRRGAQSEGTAIITDKAGPEENGGSAVEITEGATTEGERD